MKSIDLIDTVIAAHGRRQCWQAVDSIEAAFSSGGLAFALHMQPFALRGLRLSLSPHARRVTLHDFCHQGWRGIWTPDHVQIFDSQGSPVAERHQPRALFARLDKQVRWDKLDILYFAGYALWNYLGFPFILETPGVEIVEAKSPTGATPGSLLVRFDADVPTHSRLQSFHIDDSGLLIRHDYTADVIGSWAAAANFCTESRIVDGLRFYTRRRVYPRLGGRSVLPFPTLVWVTIDAIRVDYASPGGNAIVRAA